MSMPNTNQVKIGNENFKTWLKNLDPVARVEKMSAIARTQASNGLRGSLIKASLAQLSQRCQVMLIRLTDKEIKHYTRKKQKEITNNSTTEQTKKINSKNKFSKFLENTVDVNPKIEDGVTRKKLTGYPEDKPLEKKNAVSKLHAFKDLENSHPTNVSSKRLSLKLPTDTNKKLKRKFQELFGDDIDDETVAKNKSSKLGYVHENTDKNVNNYLSTTVNVNIYSSSTNNNNDNTIEKKSAYIENNILSENESSNKRLRIDLSLLNDKIAYNRSKTIVFKGCLNDCSKNTEKSHKDNTKKRCFPSNLKLHCETSKSKQRTTHPKSKKSTSSLNVNTNSSEEDPSIKELWSILGMQSPTDRSENIIKSYPLSSAEETLTFHKPPSENDIKSQSTTMKQPCETSLQEKNHCITKSSIASENKEPNQANSDSTHTAVLGNTISQESESVCKIAETFSLADITPRMPNYFDTGATAIPPKQVNQENDNLLACPENNNITREVQHVETNSFNIETISICDDDDSNNSANVNINDIQQNQNIKEHNKVGSIRVKDLGLLMNPQIMTDKNTTRGALILNLNQINCSSRNHLQKPLTKDTTSSERATQLVQPEYLVNREQESILESYYNIYKYYFDEMVESKIPKLGELLHLAIADVIRRNERIKRAEQLSSDDLIQEEKQRADKDFNDMMKIRGNEFSPLCELILKNFYEKARKTLFITLFCRILKHAEQIDPANQKYILEARTVIYFMLAEHQFKDKVVLESLQSDPEEFNDQVKLLYDLTKTNTRYMSHERNNSASGKHLSSTNGVMTSKDVASLKTINLKDYEYLAPKNVLQHCGSQNAVSQKRNPNLVGNIVSPATVILNSSVNQSSIPSNSGCLETMYHAPMSVAFVSIPQPTAFTVTPQGGAPTSTSQTYNPIPYNPCSNHMLKQILSQTITKVGTNNVPNPSSVHLNLVPMSSSPTLVPQSSLVGTTAVTQSNLNSISSIKSQLGNTTNSSGLHKKTNVAVRRLGAEMDTVTRKNHQIIIRDISDSASPAVLGLNPRPCTLKESIVENAKRLLKVANPKIINANAHVSSTVTSMTTGTTTTSVTKSKSAHPVIAVAERVPTLTTSQALPTNAVTTDTTIPSQSQVPLSSHCHPFVKRMPISGKMRMLFGNSSTKN